ncbi:crossover junction endodeoxyribonuclease RuvC [Acutalibacter sp. 1XD8-33]|uniref:crossover junction endodeoxyribonuclease RuvC n=1 Tax=Acutalibacter sp. 1XD8-33 TaxID=2320081 RepID=UPI000EA31B20|nr:crossover junction endodeoxyribonuclease RuvC [Acutalibacter sp. 1XD8-33]RKJ40255.1 crossover junction endodeoxyribonuclease RuvC [Acutalibacter sp. 1XD8-33]
MRILGVDPGYAIVGYGVVEARNGAYAPIEYGAVTTRPGEDFGLRLKEIYDGMAELLDTWKPQAASVEKLYFLNNKTTGIGVAEARGVILLALSQAAVPLYEYTPMQVKQAVTGYGKAQKHQVQEMTRKLLRLPGIPKPDDAADALALAICHGQAAGSHLRRVLINRNGGSGGVL